MKNKDTADTSATPVEAGVSISITKAAIIAALVYLGLSYATNKEFRNAVDLFFVAENLLSAAVPATGTNLDITNLSPLRYRGYYCDEESEDDLEPDALLEKVSEKLDCLEVE